MEMAFEISCISYNTAEFYHVIDGKEHWSCEQARQRGAIQTLRVL